jgi:hypothetical protein
MNLVKRLLVYFPSKAPTFGADADPEAFEICVLCHYPTSNRRSDPIDMRDEEDFVEGVGPVHPLCLRKARERQLAA